MSLTRLRMDELVNAWVADEHTPFQIALLGLFDATPFLRRDGGVDVPRLQNELAVRARQVPSLARRVVWTRSGEGRPVWATDPSFDAARHIESATLPPGTDLETWVANRIVRPLDLERPLWRAEVLDGLPEGQFGVVIVVHHVVADGLAGVALAASLLDSAPDVRPGTAAAPVVPPLPSHRELLRDRLQQTGAWLRQARPLAPGRLARLRQGARRFTDASADFRTKTAPTSLPRTVGPGRRMVVVRQPLEELRRTGHALGVTLNDLLLTSVTGGLRALLSARGDDVTGLVLRTSVPAATGRSGQADGIMVVELPVGEADPLRQLALVNATTARLKTRLRAGGGDVTDVLHLPLPMARLAVSWMRRWGGTRVTLFITNVPGPPTPLWLAGARLLHAVPVAPLVSHVPLGAAALSYADELAVSVNADEAVADLAVMGAGITRTFAALREHARVRAMH